MFSWKRSFFIAPAPPTIKRYGGENVIKEGSTKIVKCIAKGSPKPNVTWYRNNKKLSTKQSVKVPRSCREFAYEVYEEGNDSFGVHSTYTNHVLKIRSVLYPRDHAQEFKCVASNGILPDAELIIDFHVQGTIKNYNRFRCECRCKLVELNVFTNFHSVLDFQFEFFEVLRFSFPVF